MDKIIKRLRKIAGFSDYKNLLKRCLEKLDKVIDRVYPKGCFTLKLDDEDKGSKIIQVKLIPQGNTQVKPISKGYLIEISTNDSSKEELYMKLAHEITHISQKMNNFYNFQFENLRKQYGKIDKKKWDALMDVLHSDLETENEAIMVQIATALKRGNFDLAVKEMLERSTYFKTWDWKKFATKLNTVGVDGKNIEKLRQSIIKEILNEKISDAIQNSKDIGILADSVTHIAPLLHLIEYDVTKLKNFILNKIDDLDPKPREWNWNALIHQVEKL